MAPVALALQAMRGVGLIVAVTIVGEVGDFSRFESPRQPRSCDIAWKGQR
jgi:transposase